MDEAVSAPPAEPKTYRIGDKAYRQEPVSWTQETWLAEQVFAGSDPADLHGTKLLTVLQTKAPLLLGIVLIEEGWSRAAKAKAGLDAAKNLAVEIANELTPQAIREMAQDFFSLNGIANLWLLVDFGRLATAAGDGAMSSGSTPVSVVSPAATLPSATGSERTLDLLTASSTPAASSNGS